MSNGQSLLDLLTVITKDLAVLTNKVQGQEVTINNLNEYITVQADLNDIHNKKITELQCLCDAIKSIQSYLFVSLSFVSPTVYSALIAEMTKICDMLSDKNPYDVELAKQIKHLIETPQPTSKTAPHLRLVYSKNPLVDEHDLLK